MALAESDSDELESEYWRSDRVVTIAKGFVQRVAVNTVGASYSVGHETDMPPRRYLALQGYNSTAQVADTYISK